MLKFINLYIFILLLLWVFTINFCKLPSDFILKLYIKQTHINNGFLNYIVDEKTKRTIKNVTQQNIHCNTPTNEQEFTKYFYHNQMHHSNKLNENILKTLIQRNILPSDPNKK